MRGFRPSVRKEATWGTALYSPIGKLETLIRILFGIPKKGGGLTELYSDDYALKNGA